MREAEAGGGAEQLRVDVGGDADGCSNRERRTQREPGRQAGEELVHDASKPHASGAAFIVSGLHDARSGVLVNPRLSILKSATAGTSGAHVISQ